MKTEKIYIWKEGEYTWPLAFGFSPFLMSYIHDDEVKRKCIIIVPGGAYYLVSPTEGEMDALKFYEMGYNTFVLTYTTNILGTVPLKAQPMKDLSRAVRLVRKRAEEYRIIDNAVYTCGFSAGAHLTASEGIHYKDIEDESQEYNNVSNRPDAMILSYPVITSGEYAHEGSIINLLGFHNPKDAQGSFDSFAGCSNAEEELCYMSLEKQVKPDTPPSFIWQTATDEIVPVENSYMYAEACKKAGVRYAHHVFSAGKHGLSLANGQWERGEYGELYCLEPFFKLLKNAQNNVLSAEKRQNIEEMISRHHPGMKSENTGSREVAVWPLLADAFLN